MVNFQSRFIQIFLIFGFLAGAARPAHALDLFFDQRSLPAEIQSLEPASQYAYSFVLHHCADWSMAFSELTRNGIATSYSTLAEASSSELKRRWQSGGRGLQLEILLDSLGYYRGLDACFGQVRWKRDLFTVSLIMGDLLGLSTVAALGYVMLAGPGRVIKYLEGKGAFKSIGPEWRKRIKVGFWASAFSVPAGLVLLQYREKIENRRKLVQAEKMKLESLEKELQEIQTDLKALTEFAASPERTEREKKQAAQLIAELVELEKAASVQISRRRDRISQ